MKIVTRLDHENVPAGTPNVVHVLLTVTAPDLTTGKPRPQLNLAAVIDRSGSMAGQKLEYAKQSVRLLVDHLGPNDRFSLVAFDDEVLPLVEGVRASDKTIIQEMIDRIGVGSTTNLSGGWVKGIELAGREAAAEHVNAVLLLTDGQANAGITDRDQLVTLGANIHKEKAIRTSCLGLGADFNEDLLKDIATSAGGRFYYIENPDQAPEVFKEELGGLLSVVAQNVEVELKLADGVTGIAQLTGHQWKHGKSTCHILLGDFHAQQVKHILLAVQLPAMKDLTDMHLAAMRLTYAELKDGAMDIKARKQNLVVHVVDSQATHQPADPEVLLHIGLQQAAQARKEAVAQLDQGNVAGATLILERQSKKLRTMGPRTCMPDRLEHEAQELIRRVTELREQQDLGGSRKFMVSEAASMAQSNYNQTQSARQRRARPRPQTDPANRKA
jgi:Ca-activated chloride channel family protein